MKYIYSWAHSISHYSRQTSPTTEFSLLPPPSQMMITGCERQKRRRRRRRKMVIATLSHSRLERETLQERGEKRRGGGSWPEAWFYVRRDVHLSAKPESYSNPSSRHIGINKIMLQRYVRNLKQVLNIQAISLCSMLLRKKMFKKSLHCHKMIVSATDNLNGEETTLSFAQNVQAVRSLPVPSQKRMPRMSGKMTRLLLRYGFFLPSISWGERGGAVPKCFSAEFKRWRLRRSLHLFSPS